MKKNKKYTNNKLNPEQYRTEKLSAKRGRGKRGRK
jgi:hypothetical protein